MIEEKKEMKLQKKKYFIIDTTLRHKLLKILENFYIGAKLGIPDGKGNIIGTMSISKIHDQLESAAEIEPQGEIAEALEKNV